MKGIHRRLPGCWKAANVEERVVFNLEMSWKSRFHLKNGRFNDRFANSLKVTCCPFAGRLMKQGPFQMA